MAAVTFLLQLKRGSIAAHATASFHSAIVHVHTAVDIYAATDHFATTAQSAFTCRSVVLARPMVFLYLRPR
jgi:hypothetical protein